MGEHEEKVKNTPKTISVMLDLEKTCDFIDDNKAEIFVSQLDVLRKRFGADVATVCISSHCYEPEDMNKVLDVLSSHMTDTVKLGLNFYAFGTYDYNKQQAAYIGRRYNYNKLSIFGEYYLNDSLYDNQWFALIDDGLSNDVYKSYKDEMAMFVCRPAQRRVKPTENNFMSISTMTRGFDGVLEGLDSYIESTKGMSVQGVLQRQRNMIAHLSSSELIDKIRNREYAFIEKYFREGVADSDDYTTAIRWFEFTVNSDTVTSDEVAYLNNICNALSLYFSEQNDENHFETVNVFKKKLKDK